MIKLISCGKNITGVLAFSMRVGWGAVSLNLQSTRTGVLSRKAQSTGTLKNSINLEGGGKAHVLCGGYKQRRQQIPIFADL